MKRHQKSLTEIERKAKEMQYILQLIYIKLDEGNYLRAERLLNMTGFADLEDLELAVDGCVFVEGESNYEKTSH